MQEKKIKKSIIVFIIFVLLSGWVGVSVDMILIQQPEGQTLGLLIWMLSPFLTAIFLCLVVKGSEKKLGFKPQFTKNIKWYLLSVFFFPVVSIIILILGYGLGWVELSEHRMDEFLNTFLIWLVYNFFRNILEESAWRGFLTERLLKVKTNDWIIYLIVGMVWSTWHIPYYLFFVNNSDPTGMILANYLLIFSWTILFTEVYRITRTIWPCILLHAFTNAIQYTMLEDYIVITDHWNFLISPVTGIVSAIISIFVGLLVRGYRIKKSHL